jgi:hypothetical protein
VRLSLMAMASVHAVSGYNYILVRVENMLVHTDHSSSNCLSHFTVPATGINWHQGHSKAAKHIGNGPALGAQPRVDRLQAGRRRRATARASVIAVASVVVVVAVVAVAVVAVAVVATAVTLDRLRGAAVNDAVDIVAAVALADLRRHPAPRARPRGLEVETREEAVARRAAAAVGSARGRRR